MNDENLYSNKYNTRKSNANILKVNAKLMKRKIVLQGKIYATEAGLEPAKEFPSRFLVYRLNRSAIQSELDSAVNITNIYMYAFPILHYSIRTES